MVPHPPLHSPLHPLIAASAPLRTSLLGVSRLLASWRRLSVDSAALIATVSTALGDFDSSRRHGATSSVVRWPLSLNVDSKTTTTNTTVYASCQAHALLVHLDQADSAVADPSCKPRTNDGGLAHLVQGERNVGVLEGWILKIDSILLIFETHLFKVTALARAVEKDLACATAEDPAMLPPASSRLLGLVGDLQMRVLSDYACKIRTLEDVKAKLRFQKQLVAMNVRPNTVKTFTTHNHQLDQGDAAVSSYLHRRTDSVAISALWKELEENMFDANCKLISELASVLPVFK